MADSKTNTTTTIYEPFVDGTVVELDFGDLSTDSKGRVELKPGDDLNKYRPDSFVLGETTIIYDELTKYDAWTMYDNAFTFHDGTLEEGEEDVAFVDNKLPHNTTVTFKLGVGDRRSAPTGSYKNYYRVNSATLAFLNDVDVSCSGDIRTLVNYECYETVNTSTARFMELFKGCTNLIQGPELPANILAEYCYKNMFYGFFLNENTYPLTIFPV